MVRVERFEFGHDQPLTNTNVCFNKTFVRCESSNSHCRAAHPRTLCRNSDQSIQHALHRSCHLCWEGLVARSNFGRRPDVTKQYQHHTWVTRPAMLAASFFKKNPK